LGGVATLAVACVAVADRPVALLLATAAGVACMGGSFFSRWAAAGALLVAAAGLLIVFASFVQSRAGVTWGQVTAMVAYGLTLIAAVMVLVERKVEAGESSSSEPGAARA